MLVLTMVREAIRKDWKVRELLKRERAYPYTDREAIRKDWKLKELGYREEQIEYELADEAIRKDWKTQVAE